MNRFLVTGATGFIGRALVTRLTQSGRRVTCLSRDAATAHQRLRGVDTSLLQIVELGPEPPAVERLSQCVAEQDAIVNLAGERVVGVRYTRAAKRRILDSRIGTTERIIAALARASKRPSVLCSASGVGYYGPRPPSARLTESAAPGDDFVAHLAQAWEQSAHAAEAHGVRVVTARLGVVLGAGGGALAEMVKPFKLGLGGPIGSGAQMISWIHLEDAVEALLFLCERADARGPVNVCAPEALSNAELAQGIGRALGRSWKLKTPAWALELLFGEGAQPLLTGQAAVPEALTRLGFRFRHPGLREALAASLSHHD
jgi:uncharacterized protein